MSIVNTFSLQIPLSLSPHNFRLKRNACPMISHANHRTGFFYLIHIILQKYVLLIFQQSLS